MISSEELQVLINEYIAGVQKGDFNDIENIPDHYTYGHLIGMFFFSKLNENGKELFTLFYKCIKMHSRMKLKQKFKENGKIKVAFLAISAAEWSAEKLYRAIEKDDRFEVSILGLKMTDRAEEYSNKTYQMLRDKFDNENYNFVSGVDAVGKILSWKEIGVPEICIHLTPWWEGLDRKQSLVDLPISTVNMYIQYGFYTEADESGDYVQNSVYNKEFMNAMDTVFMDSQINYEGYEKYQILQGENVVASGYTKMDFFYDEHNYSEDDIKSIWKIPEGKSAYDTKKVIIAPHYSIGTKALLKYSTFEKNYNFLYYLAKKYENISFVFKPHPNLRKSSVEEGLFDSIDEYEEYLNKWNLLPNAKVVDEATYLEIFDTSDAMIMDSASFLVEYIYANKPSLFLTRKGQVRNKFGEKIYEGWYKVDGNDYMGIENFLKEKVIDGIDELADVRKSLYDKYLDYRAFTGKEAYEFIYDTINELISD